MTEIEALLERAAGVTVSEDAPVPPVVRLAEEVRALVAERDAALAAHEAAGGGWRPIETAPRDGTKVWVCGGEFGEGGVARWKHNDRHAHQGRPFTVHHGGAERDLLVSYFGDVDDWDDWESALPESQPTHWRPLPPTPAAATPR